MSGVDLDEEERAVWRAAYAAAFVDDFNNMARGDHRAHGVGFDRAVESTSAERAITVADLAVCKLRDWRLSEAPDAGRKLWR